jgi:hypothetical protein
MTDIKVTRAFFDTDKTLHVIDNYGRLWWRKIENRRHPETMEVTFGHVVWTQVKLPEHPVEEHELATILAAATQGRAYEPDIKPHELRLAQANLDAHDGNIVAAYQAWRKA